MVLKGIDPEVVVPQKPKILFTGTAGTGKSIFALNAPTPFYIDTESGANREQYMRKLIASKGTYFGPLQGSQNFEEMIGQVKELGTTKHRFKSVVLDSMTKPFYIEKHNAEERGVSSEFKKSQKEAEKHARRLMSWFLRPDFDMTVIIICHAKDKWTREGKELIKEGTTWDGPEKLDHEVDLWLETRSTPNSWSAVVRKSRIEAFKLGSDMPLDFEAFKRMYGEAVIDRPIKPIVLASQEQIAKVRHIVDLLKITPEELEKWLVKAQVTELEDLSEENAVKFIEFLEKKIKGESK